MARQYAQQRINPRMTKQQHPHQSVQQLPTAHPSISREGSCLCCELDSPPTDATRGPAAAHGHIIHANRQRIRGSTRGQPCLLQPQSLGYCAFPDKRNPRCFKKGFRESCFESTLEGGWCLLRESQQLQRFDTGSTTIALRV